ncbi:hypothetical protein PsAD37_04734 [Pseudovibrio sp. Ad37]|nr:hypothetical protein PsAD37_04734 [Pseudovibrio sp. Ad37]
MHCRITQALSRSTWQNHKNTKVVSAAAEKMSKDIRRKTHKRYSTEDKIRSELLKEALAKSEQAISELGDGCVCCRSKGSFHRSGVPHL